MDQGPKMLPLLAVLLIIWRCAFGFPGGLYSKTNLQWGQASHSAFAPRVVQSSQSEYPVTGSISVDEVDSSLIIDRSQKSTSRFANPRRYVKGGFSSSHKTSRTQTGSVFAALALPQEERQTSSLTALQPQVSSSSNVQNIASQLASGQSLQNQYSSSSHGGSGLQSAGGLSQIVSHQREGSSSGLLSSPGVPSPHTPESDVKLSSSPLMVSTQATTAQSSPILNMSSTLESSGPLLGVSVSASSSYGAPGASTEHVSSPSLIYHQPAGEKGSLSIHASVSESSLPLQLSGAAVNVNSSESLSSNPSIETQGSNFTSQVRPITAQVISSGPVIVITPEVSRGSIGSPSQSIYSQYSPGTLTPRKLGSLSMRVSSQSTKAQCLYMNGSPSRSAMPVHTGSSSRDLSSSKPQGISAVYAPSSPSKYLNVAASSPQSVSFQSGSDQDFLWAVTQVGTQAGKSKLFMSSQGGSSSYSGALSQPQSSPRKYSSGALKHTSPQTLSSPFTSEVSLHGNSGAPLGGTSQSATKGMSSSFSASSFGTSSQNVPSSPTFSKLSSSRQVNSQSRSDLGLYPQLSATSGIGSHDQKGSSPQLSQAASGFNSGSLPQFQGSLDQYAPASPSKYVNVPIASQALATQSATASSRRVLTSTFLGGSQSGSSLTLQGSGTSSMPQGTMSQFVYGSPSQYSRATLFSTQSVAGQYSPAFQRVFSVSQRPQRQEPSASSLTQGLQSSGAALSQGNYQSQSSQVQRFSSPLSARDSAYQSNPQALFGGDGQLVSSPESSVRYSGISLQSQNTSSRYPLGSSQSAKDQSSSIYDSTAQTGSGAQLSSSSNASLQGGSSSVVGSSQHGSVFSPLNAKAALHLSRPSAAILTQGSQSSKTASSQPTSSAQIFSGFSSSLSALSQNVVHSGPMSAVRRSQSLFFGVQRPSMP
ncbi:hypothetical protein E1301_Tti000508 [Triplophysa tibetana]|uniref:Uncharacterized protein n=1 Tax=Triplophysa tibetana TaxID=1572043 RepID=A0A5A9N3P9_9TELE|nr:hypothetical protein E1301_Tti000508 [Triplophysa tibetana]